MVERSTLPVDANRGPEKSAKEENLINGTSSERRPRSSNWGSDHSLRTSSPSKCSRRKTHSSYSSQKSDIGPSSDTASSSPSSKSSSRSASPSKSSRRPSSPSKSSHRTSSPSKSSHRSSSPLKSNSHRSSSPSKRSRTETSGQPKTRSSSPGRVHLSRNDSSSSPHGSIMKTTEDKVKEATQILLSGEGETADANGKYLRRSFGSTSGNSVVVDIDSIPLSNRGSRRASMAFGENTSNPPADNHSTSSGDGKKTKIRIKIRRVKSDKPEIPKSVRFSEASPDLKENTLYCDEEVDDLWYNQLDLNMFKDDIEQTLDQITDNAKQSEAWRKSLSRAYEMSCRVDSEDSFKEKRSATYKLVKYRLKDVFMETDEVVGLESLLADQIKSDSNRRRARVLDLNDKLRAERQRRKRLGIQLEGDHLVDAEKLFQESIEASRASRYFAYGLAVSQYAAFKEQRKYEI